MLDQQDQLRRAALSEKAVGVLDQMIKVEGSDAAAMANTQVLIAQLAGERCTEELITELKSFLRSKHWRCVVGVVNQPISFGAEEAR